MIIINKQLKLPELEKYSILLIFFKIYHSCTIDTYMIDHIWKEKMGKRRKEN